MSVKRTTEESSGAGGLTVFLVIVILAALCAGAYLVFTQTDALSSFFNAPQTSRFAQALEENNYQAAYTLYAASGDADGENGELKEHLEQYFSLCLSEKYDDTVWPRYRGLEIFREQIEQDVFGKMDQLVYAYYQDVLTEDDARVYLSRVGKFGFADRYLTECADLVKARDASRAAYNEGMAYLEENEYESAVRALRQVREQDVQYENAQKAIEKCRAEYGEKQLERAREMLSANNKNGARQTAEDLIDLFGAYPEAEKLLSSITMTAE